MLIKLGFYRRKPGLSLAEFHHLWSDVYGPLYGKHPELSRHLRRYVQHRVAPILDAMDQMVPFDGFSEVWFDNAEASEALVKEPLFLEKIAPLVSSFLDLENSKFAAYDSQVYQIGGAPPLFGV
jgi:hypothetical protein